jgi:NTE family protein
VARYGRTTSRAGLNLGANLGAASDVRLGAYVGHTKARIEVGDPNLPEIAGRDTGADLTWRLDTQDSPVVPSRGVFSQVRLAHAFEAPDIASVEDPVSASASFTQLTFNVNTFRVAGKRGRVFAFGGLGTSLDGDVPPTSIFSLGSAFRLGAYAPGEIRGRHAWTAGAGYLRHAIRLPDFIGGPVYLGGWLENGDAFDDWSDAKWRSNVSIGAIMDTLVGPVVLAGTTGFDGRWRTYLGIGRVFR